MKLTVSFKNNQPVCCLLTAAGKIKVPASASELFPLKGTAKLVSFQKMSEAGPESSKSTFQVLLVIV